MRIHWSRSSAGRASSSSARERASRLPASPPHTLHPVAGRSPPHDPGSSGAPRRNRPRPGARRHAARNARVRTRLDSGSKAPKDEPSRPPQDPQDSATPGGSLETAHGRDVLARIYPTQLAIREHPMAGRRLGDDRREFSLDRPNGKSARTPAMLRDSGKAARDAAAALQLGPLPDAV